MSMNEDGLELKILKSLITIFELKKFFNLVVFPDANII